MRAFVIAFAVVVIAAPVRAQTEPPVTAVAPNPPTPMTGKDRIGWVVDGNASPRSMAAGVFVAAWSTARNEPPEWARTWTGYGKRYMWREADLAVTNGVEAGVGMLWGEDPRYVRESGGPILQRIGHAVRMAFVARRHDAEIPAYARYTANVADVFIAEQWLPPSASRASDRTRRLANAFVGRSLANLWEEFWPDLRARLRH